MGLHKELSIKRASQNARSIMEWNYIGNSSQKGRRFSRKILSYSRSRPYRHYRLGILRYRPYNRPIEQLDHKGLGNPIYTKTDKARQMPKFG